MGELKQTLEFYGGLFVNLEDHCALTAETIDRPRDLTKDWTDANFFFLEYAKYFSMRRLEIYSDDNGRGE